MLALPSAWSKHEGVLERVGGGTGRDERFVAVDKGLKTTADGRAQVGLRVEHIGQQLGKLAREGGDEIARHGQ